jgi:c-di-GMP-binding flagellar brake protein YcgR
MNLVEREKRLTLHLPVEVRGEDQAGRRFVERTRTLNVSGGGLCLESRRTLEIGARLSLAIELPPKLRRHFGDRELYRARAVVCRVERPATTELARVGARFLREVEPGTVV